MKLLKEISSIPNILLSQKEGSIRIPVRTRNLFWFWLMRYSITLYRSLVAKNYFSVYLKVCLAKVNPIKDPVDFPNSVIVYAIQKFYRVNPAINSYKVKGNPVTVKKIHIKYNLKYPYIFRPIILVKPVNTMYFIFGFITYINVHIHSIHIYTNTNTREL